jgi:hypothetical protein
LLGGALKSRSHADRNDYCFVAQSAANRARAALPP